MEERPKKKFKSIFHVRTYSDFLDLTDGRVKSEDGYSFDVHRYQLAKSSDYFQAMFCDFQNRDRREFTVPGISGECLGEVLHYIYSGTVPVTDHNIADLLVASDYLLMKDLYRAVKGNLERFLTAENACRVLAAAMKIDDGDISRRSFRFIQTRFEVVVRAGRLGLVDLPADVLHKVLSNRSICARGESTVWRVIVEWIQESKAERLEYAPRLLSSLARKELDEDLASEMLQHEIIKGNPFLGDLNDVADSENFSRNLEVVLNYLDRFEGMDCRIPPELHVVLAKNDGTTKSSTLYVTFDENMDLWRPVGDVNFNPEYAILIGHTVFVSGEYECWKFDLTNQQCSLLRNLRTLGSPETFSFVGIDGKLFVMGEGFDDDEDEYSVHVYDPDMDTWSIGMCSTSVLSAVAVEVSKKIYAVGYIPDGEGMLAQVFDVEARQWSPLPAPSDSYHAGFWLVSLRGCLYLIGGLAEGDNSTKVEIFDTGANAWTHIAEIPHVYEIVKAVVWKDQIVVFDCEKRWNDSESVVCWNEEKNRWEPFDKSSRLDFTSQLFCTVSDVGSVAKIIRSSRNLENPFVKSSFISEHRTFTHRPYQ